MYHNKDVLWKGLLEWVFDDLLRFLFPDADQVFDMERGFGFMDKELAEMYPAQDKKTATRVVDKLVKAYRRDGKEEWVLVHLEVQGETKPKDRPLFPARMFRYFIRIYDRYEVPVAAIAIFSGPDGKKLPDTFGYQFLDTRLQYRFNTLCILDYPDEQLKTSDNPFAWVVYAAKMALLTGRNMDEQLLAGKLFIFRELYKRGVFEKRKLRAILIFLNSYVRFKNPETRRTFNEEVDKITEKRNTMDIFEQVAEIRHEEGLQEGRKLGRKEGAQQTKRIVVENLLKNPKLSLNEMAAIAEVSLSFVKKVKKELGTQ